MPATASAAASQVAPQVASAASAAGVQAANWLAPGSLSFELVKGMPAAFVALVIGLIAAGIAYRQAEIARAKLKLDLFDRRYELYLLLWEFLSEGTVVPPPTDGPQVVRFRELHAKFFNAIPQAYFLFGREIGEFFESVRKNANDHNFALRRLQSLPTDHPDRSASEEALLSFEQWANNELTGLRVRFQDHMSFERWRR